MCAVSIGGGLHFWSSQVNLEFFSNCSHSFHLGTFSSGHSLDARTTAKPFLFFNMHCAWAGHLLLETQIEDDTYLFSESVKCGLHMCICICICIWTIFVFGLYTYLFSESVKCGLHRRWSVGWEEQMVEVMISSAPLLCRLVVLWFGSLGHFGGGSISSCKVWCSAVIYDMVLCQICYRP